MHKNILLIGDNCLDVYYYGNVERISPEAPIPILNFMRKEERPGMGANVMENLEKLGLTVSFSTSGMSVKTRFIDETSKQHLLRLDKDPNRMNISIKEISSHLKNQTWHAVAITDYCKGAITDELIKYVIQEYKGPIFLDTKKQNLSEFEGCIIKINNKEFSNAKSLPAEGLIVTHGPAGVTYNRNTFFQVPEIDVVDVCGAGDTFFSALIYKYLDNNDIKTAIKFAIAASSITVKHTGVYAPSLKEIMKVYNEDN